MLKINEDGSCQRIGLNGQAVEGEEPRKIEEFGAGGLDRALKSIPKEGEAHEVTAVRGKFSTVRLDKLDSSDDEEPADSSATVKTLKPSGSSKAETSKPVEEDKSKQIVKQAGNVWKIPVRFIFINKQGRFTPQTEIEIEANSSIEVLFKSAIKFLGINIKEVGDVQMQEMAHGVTKTVTCYTDTVNPDALYAVHVQHRFAVKEPICMNLKYSTPDGGIKVKTVKLEEEAVDGPSTMVFKYFLGERFIDLNSVKAEKDGKEVNVRKIVTEPGTYDVTVGSKKLKAKNNVLYHIRIISRSSMDSRCETVEIPEQKGSFNEFWTTWAPTIGLKPQNLHKLAQVGTGPLKDMPFNERMTPFGYYLVAYSGDF